MIEVLGGGFHAVPGKFELTVQLTRIMYPFILLVSLAALVMGMLNARHVFGAPAMASSFFNLGSIVGGVGLGYVMDPHFGPGSLFGLAWGTLIGGFLQLVVQFPALRRAGYWFRPDFAWRDPGVRAIGRLMVPAVIAASAVQINVMVNASFASHQGDGAVTWLNNAFRLMQLPLGVFGVAIATVTLPLVSRSAALGDTAGFRTTLGKALRLAFFLTVPSAVGLWCLGEPIIALLFQHGRFGPEATRQTAAALQFYAPRAGGLRRDQGVGPGVLRGGRADDAHDRELHRHRHQRGLERVLHLPPRLGPPRTGALDEPHGDDQLRPVALAHAPSRRRGAGRGAGVDAGEVGGGRRAPGRRVLGGAALGVGGVSAHFRSRARACGSSG